MKASETSLRNLLEGGKQFQIPLFQRPYAWEKKNWMTLWEDLMSLYNDEVEGSYFLGSIVTQSISGTTADGISPFIVIDGQQRLITLTIFLATLRHCLLEQNKKQFAEELYELYLINKFKQNDDFYKVLPTQDDRKIYQDIISVKNKNYLNHNNKDSKIYLGYKFFKSQINNSSPKDNEPVDLTKLKTIVLERLSLVNITSEEEDNPYLIFESLNHKGQALTQADLVRNYVFMKLPTEQREKIYSNLWLPFQEQFKVNINNDKYIEEITKAFWFYSRKDGAKVTQKEVYKAIKKRFDNSEENIESELKKLIRFTDYYQRLKFEEKEQENKLRICFKRINRLNFDTCHVFLLNIYEDYQNNRISLEEFEQVLLCIESYLVRRFFAGISTQTLGIVFNNLYNEIKKNNSNNLINGLHQVLINHQGNKRFPEDDEFRKSIIEKDIYDTTPRDRVKFILERIENYLCLEKVNTEEITIEHIMPQSLSDKWKQALGVNHEIIHKESVHKIGNLTLTGCNSNLSNKSFIEKKGNCSITAEGDRRAAK
ncbi:MAG: DUF262 domain-containing protein [Xenococcaceae cyanobacterium]